MIRRCGRRMDRSLLFGVQETSKRDFATFGDLYTDTCIAERDSPSMETTSLVGRMTRYNGRWTIAAPGILASS